MRHRLRRRPAATFVARLLVNGVLKYHRIVIEGAENLPRQGPALILPKHRAYRDILIEGIAFGTRHMIETFADIGAAPGELTAVGGGVQNRLWLQATSDITGLAQLLRQESIGASFGNAMLAAHAAGLKPRAWQDWNPISDRVTPCADPAYDKAYTVFRDIYDATKDIMARL